MSVMDSVELSFPVDVSPAPKLIAAEGLVRSDRVSIVVNHSIEYGHGGCFVFPSFNDIHEISFF